MFSTFMVVAATIPLLLTDWNITATRAGGIVTAFTIAYAFSLFGFAFVADYVGAKRMVLVSALAAATSSVLFAFFADGYGPTVFFYTLIGLSQGGLYTPMIMLFTDEVEVQNRGRVMGFLIASTSIGYTLSLSVAAVGIAVGGVRAAFLFTGLMPLFGAAILLVALRPARNRIHTRAPGGGLAQQFKNSRDARLLFTGYCGHTWELLGSWAWTPAFLAAVLVLAGGSDVAASVTGSFTFGMLHLAGAAASLMSGRLSDKRGRKPVLVGGALMGAISSFVFGWLIALPFTLVVVAAVIYTFATISDSPVLTTAIAEVVDPGYRGAVLAWRGLAGVFVGGIAPLAFGAVYDAASASTTLSGFAWAFGFMTIGLGGLVSFVSASRLTGRVK
jgi:MFS family permease